MIKKLNEAPAYFDSGDIRYGIDIATHQVIEQPTADVVEVVRCEKCRFACFQYNTDKYPFGVYACKKQPTGRAYKKVKGSHFCSYGELKEREGK